MLEPELLKEVDQFFEDEAVLLGGMVAAYGMDDDLICQLMDSLSAIREKMIWRLETQAGKDRSPEIVRPFKPHPAIEKFLMSLSSHRHRVSN